MRALVYPYDENFEVFIRYGRFVNDIKILEILSPIGWGLKEKVVGENLVVKTDVKDVDWEGVEALLLIDSIRTNLNMDEIMRVVTFSVKQGKNIILNRNVNDEIYSRLVELCEEERVSLIDFRNQDQWQVVNDRHIKTINTPIVVVAGMGEHCNKLEVQLYLKKYLRNLEYKVCLVSSRVNTAILGAHSFPDFMFGNKLDESSKIINFNHFIKKLEIEEKPDIILIGIPGSIMPVSEKHSEYFGVFAFEVFNAIKSDVLLLCMHNNIYTNEYFEEVQKLFKYRYQSDIDAIIISNYAYDSFSLETEGEIKYLSFDDAEVDRYIADYPQNVYGRTAYEKLAENVIAILSDYADCQVM
ncbi:MAG: TIGR04066 family peptide maturation system protein [Lachnospiraceae bacterium]|nr:TIGR04066 family peptide maturation system protein [Lachnospiraceae bacterium]